MSVFESMKKDESFASIYEYEELLRAIKHAELQQLIEQVPVVAKRPVPQIENWYREMSTGVVYSLCPPEFPAKGYWGPVPLGEFELPPQIH